MPSIEEVIVPRRDEQIQVNGKQATLRYMSYFEQLSKQVNSVSSVVGSTTSEITGATHTTSGNEVLICDVPCTITLNATPADEEIVTVKRLNGLVSVLGNGRNIDNSSTIMLSRDLTSLDFFYVLATDKWYIM